MDEAIAAWVTATVAEPARVVERSWPDGKSRVWELFDARGARWFVKQHLEDEWYDTERRAYERWVGALGDRAPRLVAADDGLRALATSALPPQDGDWRSEAARRDAGALLRRLHESEDCGRCDDLRAEKEQELEEWLTRGGDLLDRGERQIARAAVAGLHGCAAPPSVPCHRDYTPRNWVVAGGRVHVLDFEEMQPDAWVVDLGRMAVNWWRDQPETMDAVLAGYGRPLGSDDVELMRRCHVVTTVRLIVLAARYGKREFGEAMRRDLTYLGSVLA
jgi:hypothetical protein